jgi:hypothetical protein
MMAFIKSLSDLENGFVSVETNNMGEISPQRGSFHIWDA